MKKSLFCLILMFAFSSLPAFSANTPKPGSACSKQGITKTYKGKKYTCIKSGKKLVWNKGVALKQAAPQVTPSPSLPKTPSPTPTPTPPITPTTSPTSTPTEVSSPSPTFPGKDRDSVSKGIQKLIDNARISSAIGMPKITWIFTGNPSSREKQLTIDGFKKSLEFYARVGLPVSDSLILNVDTMESLYSELDKANCKFRKDFLPTRAGFFLPNTCQNGNGAVTAFIWDIDKWDVNGFEFQSILAHEYFHQIQQTANRNMGNSNFPKWFWEGGAVFFSGTAYAYWNLGRNYEEVLMSNFSGNLYKSALDEPCRKATIKEISELATPSPKQSCAYSKGAMLAEYFVAKYGVAKYVQIITENREYDFRNFGVVFRLITNQEIDDFYSEGLEFLSSRGWN